MDKPRGTKEFEFNQVLDLINETFRINRGYLPTMELEFPLLLTKSNKENMRIIEKDGYPVSCVNFVERSIRIEEAKILSASIGAVCTKDEYRGRGYSSLILDDVERKMEQDGVDVALVSGTRALYQRRGFTLTKNFLKYEILPEKISLDFTIEEFKDRDLIEISKLYNRSTTRYVRNIGDFKKLIKSALFSWGNISYKSYVLKDEDTIIGYIFTKIITNEEANGVVVEAFGPRDYIKKALKYIGYMNKLKSIEYKVHISDRSNFLHIHGEKKLDYQEGAVKIINFTRFMDKLKPYFLQYVDETILNEIKFQVISKTEKSNVGVQNLRGKNEIKVEETKDINTNPGLKDFKFNVSEDILKEIEVVEQKYVYRIVYKDEILEINDIWTLNKLVFEGIDELEINSLHKPNVHNFIDTVFPIPFIYAANLNYQ